MITLKSWRRRVQSATKRGEFTRRDKSDCGNSCKCAIAEVAKLQHTTYDEIKCSLPNSKLMLVLGAEVRFMEAVGDDKPIRALKAIKRLEKLLS